MTSVWEIKTTNKYPELKENIETDVAVIGGGLAGLWCAYLLSREGKRVVVVEKDRLGHGTTLYTTAFITQAIDTALGKLVHMFGERQAKLIWRSGEEAINLIEKVSKDEEILCDFMRLPLYVYARNEDEFHNLGEEYKWATKFGFDTALIKNAKLGLKNDGVLEIRHQAKFHPMKFFYGLLRAADELGVKFYEHTEALEIVGSNPVKVVTTAGNIITAQSAIVATYDPLNNPKPVHFKKGMYTSYVLEFRTRGEYKDAIFVDQENPYHYIRVDKITKDSARFIVGGEDHRQDIGQNPAKPFNELRKYASGILPKDMKLVRRWRGPILEPSDGLALIGETGSGQYLASAFSGNGMTYACLSGMIIRDLILGKKNPYTKLYDPQRKLDMKALLYKARDYTGEFFGGVGKNLFR